MNITNVTKPRFRNREEVERVGLDLRFGPEKVRLYTSVFDPDRPRFLGHFLHLYTHERFFRGLPQS